MRVGLEWGFCVYDAAVYVVCGGYEDFSLAHLVLEVGDLGGEGEVPERSFLYSCCIYCFGFVEGVRVR